jgi:hypothetical protein
MPNDAPTKPILALTLALAGKRQIAADDLPEVEGALRLAFDAIGARLAALGAETHRSRELAARFTGAARLTLITGLADGADQLAGRLFRLSEPQPAALERVLGAVLPCSAAAFALDSPVDDPAAFEAAVGCCDFIIELDGVLAAPEEGSGAREAKRGRAAAFAAQSELLLRNADILVAIDHPDDEGRVGGTRQTVERALDHGMPVILLRLGEEGLSILRDRAHLDDPFQREGADAQAGLAALVDEMIGAPLTAQSAAAAAWDDYELSILEEVFAPSAPAAGFLNALWSAFEGRFKTKASRTNDVAPPPYRLFRARASALSAYYAGLYRGSFLLGYILAVVAVMMAVMSLVILLLGVRLGWPIMGVELVMLTLGLMKFAAVLTIARLGERAKHRRLAYRATDYRYLSERLRAMIFLPHAGSLRANFDWSPPYALRVEAQGVIDHLFLAILRQAAPLETLPGTTLGKVVRPDAARALEVIRDGWLRGQLGYHRANARTHEKMKTALDALGRSLNTLVVAVVAVDIALIALGLTGVMPEAVEGAVRGWAAPVLIAVAAILPAAVASLNGVRFQSEVSRLAERSEQMAVNLARLEQLSFPLAHQPPRAVDAMRLGDNVARLTNDEVAEWSAIYGKEFVEM